MKLNVCFKEDEELNVSFAQDSSSFIYDFGEIQTVTSTDYEALFNKPSINGVILIGDKTGEDLNLGSAIFPSGGVVGDLLSKSADGAEWITPASAAEQDNTRPITAAAVYTEIGNINALLAAI